ncbi:MAG: flavodoxin [Paludibacter sp.]|jgi:menaquinone-dependent protoporphyrinogen oxidase|nr:flavodoxin [Paludibacter sp.]
MKTAIIYATKHGTTEKVAHLIAEKIADNEIKIFNLKKDKKIPLASFDAFIIGTAVYAGLPINVINDFYKIISGNLLGKKLGLFVCGMEQNVEKQQLEISNAFHSDLLNVAVAKAFCGGEFYFDKMNFLERMIVHSSAKTNKNVSEINYANIDKFVEDWKNAKL